MLYTTLRVCHADGKVVSTRTTATDAACVSPALPCSYPAPLSAPPSLCPSRWDASSIPSAVACRLTSSGTGSCVSSPMQAGAAARSEALQSTLRGRHPRGDLHRFNPGRVFGPGRRDPRARDRLRWRRPSSAVRPRMGVRTHRQPPPQLDLKLAV